MRTLFFVGLAFFLIGLAGNFGILPLSTYVQPSVGAFPVSISYIDPNACIPIFGSPCASNLLHAVTTDNSKTLTVMIVIYLGSYAVVLGDCTTSYCQSLTNQNLAVWGTNPLVVNWGDGTTTSISNYWYYCNNLNICTAFAPPGDGVGQGFAYTNYQFFYHTYSSPGTYTITIPTSQGPSITPATIQIGTVSSTTTTSTSQTTSSTTLQSSTSTSTSSSSQQCFLAIFCPPTTTTTTSTSTSTSSSQTTSILQSTSTSSTTSQVTTTTNAVSQILQNQPQPFSFKQVYLLMTLLGVILMSSSFLRRRD